ncbi:MAG: hypothetical protein AAB794_03940 [Patescibacteria group bacterium]
MEYVQLRLGVTVDKAILDSVPKENREKLRRRILEAVALVRREQACVELHFDPLGRLHITYR